eukprot:COSAG03_NODE_26250_length_260_cov_0.652174_1_plen_64_part_10
MACRNGVVASIPGPRPGMHVVRRRAVEQQARCGDSIISVSGAIAGRAESFDRVRGWVDFKRGAR